MGDLITNDPRRRPFGWVAGAALLGLIIAGVVIFRPSPTPERVSGSVPSAPVSSASPGSNLPPPGFPKLRQKTGLTLYVSRGYPGDPAGELMLFDMNDRRSIRVVGLSPVAGVKYQVLPVAGGAIVIVPQDPDRGFDGPTEAYVVRGPRAIRHFPVTGPVTMSADDRSIWISDKPGSVRRIDLFGHPIGARYRLPSGSVLMTDTIRGLLLSHGQDVVLWDPASGKSRRIAEYLTSNADTIVAVDRGLRVTNLRTGTTRTVSAQIERGPAALTADGTLLALARDDSFGVQHFVVLDIPSGQITDLGGFSNGNQAGFRWAGNSHWLVTSSLRGTAKLRAMIAIWQPGMVRPAFVENLPPNYYVLN